MAKAQRKTQRKLAERRAAYQGGTSSEWRYQPSSGGGTQTYHRPGSQNRSK